MCAAGRTLAEPRLSPDATAIVVHVRDGAGPRLVRMDLGTNETVNPGPELILTYDPPVVGVHPSGGGSWTWAPNGNTIVYVARNGLFEIPATGGPGRAIVLSDDSISSPTISSDGTLVAYIRETDAGQSVWTARLDGSQPPKSIAAAHEATFRYDPAWRPGTHELIWHEWEMPNMAWDHSVLAGAASPEPVVGTGPDGPCAVGQPSWSPDGSRLGYVSDSSGWMVVTVDGKAVVAEEFEHGAPTWGPGQRSWAWSPDSQHVVFNRNESGYARLVVATSHDGSTTELAKAWHIGISWSQTATGNHRVAAVRTGATTPAQLVVYDLGPTPSSTAVRTVIARGPVAGWEQCGLREPLVVTWTATDGATLHGRLYLPDLDERNGPTAPVIVSIHGGPTDQSTVQFNARFAYWLSQGWAIFVPDYRGSSGHGRKYQQAMNGGWGVIDTDDVASGLRWLQQCADVDATRIVLIGGSAGGFTVLNLLADTNAPKAIVGAVVLYPVTDLGELDATTHRFERTYNATIVGPPSLYAERSPATKAARIGTPLLLLHGDSDPVVNVEQSRRLVANIEAAGGAVEYVEYPGEGHGWKRPETMVDELRRIDELLRRVHPPTMPS